MKRFKKILTFSFLIFLLSISLSLPTRAADPGDLKSGVGFISASSLRLRSGPSTSESVLGYATKGEVVVLLEKVGSWYKVLYNLQEGYMHQDYLQTTTVENVELGYGKVNYSKVNMRIGPGTSYSRVGQSSENDLCYIIGINKQWYKVIWNDQICYIRSDYLTLTEYPYENRASAKSPLFFRGGFSTGTPVSVSTLKNSSNYIASTGSSKASAIITTAKKHIGVPYVWGGTTPSGFDCSGFVQYVFKQHGVSLNRTTRTQYQHGSFVTKSNLQPGDLVFFQNTYTTGISHVGIYIGNGDFIHASSSKGVVISSLSNSYWSSHYYGARRVL
jgi:cell wall-associated NlpC family hydrolase